MFLLIRYQWIIDSHSIGYFPRQDGINRTKSEVSRFLWLTEVELKLYATHVAFILVIVGTPPRKQG